MFFASKKKSFLANYLNIKLALIVTAFKVPVG